jgi:hypothetical protein
MCIGIPQWRFSTCHQPVGALAATVYGESGLLMGKRRKLGFHVFLIWQYIFIFRL